MAFLTWLVLQEWNARRWLDGWEQRYLRRLIVVERGIEHRLAWNAVEERLSE